MKICELVWDDDNIDHIAKHNVTPDEVEDVCFGLHISKKESMQRYILKWTVRWWEISQRCSPADRPGIVQTDNSF